MQLPAPTSRVSFRAWNEDDLPHAKAIWSDPRLATMHGGPYNEAQVRARLETEIANQREYGVSYWQLVNARGERIGCCGLAPREPARRVFELGIYLLVPWWRQGYGVEAAHSVFAHAFGVLGSPSVFGAHHPDNHASRRTLLSLGFRYTHDELWPPVGLMFPCYELRADHYSHLRTTGRSREA
jgi:RimJ/RimL family protein N-acetyltransferase